MMACTSWSVPYVKKLLEAKAKVDLTESSGKTAMDIVSDLILIWEDKKETEKKAARMRRLEMEITGAIGFDRADVEDLEPYKSIPDLYEIKGMLEKAGAKPGTSVKCPGYD
mmetsp:Transcript_19107/g.33112  ORF Transcript_19107/g.33112 Transcript_19107/m.33112 type:complete len:111 (-) Transcript_19107:104-436(-)